MSFLKMTGRFAACLLCAVMSLASLSGCGKTVGESTTAKDSGSDVSSTESNGEGSDASASKMYDKNKSESDYKQCLDDTAGYSDMANYNKPVNGEQIIQMTIKDKGTVKIKLFPDLMPKACANFVGLAQNGYYDGLTFHRILKDFMIQGGDPQGTGMGGESVWSGQFDGGNSKYLYHVNSGSTSTDGSQFYIVVGTKFTDDLLQKYSPEKYSEYTDTVKKAYAENGGTPWLDGGYTVFGQVFEGMDIVTDICNNTEADSQSGKPAKDVIIDKVEVVEYKG